jgi:hypothetical protein
VRTLIPETRVTADAGLFGEDVVVVPLDVADDFLETASIVGI